MRRESREHSRAARQKKEEELEGQEEQEEEDMLAALPKGIAATLRHLGSQIARTSKHQQQRDEEKEKRSDDRSAQFGWSCQQHKNKENRRAGTSRMADRDCVVGAASEVPAEEALSSLLQSGWRGFSERQDSTANKKAREEGARDVSLEQSRSQSEYSVENCDVIVRERRATFRLFFDGLEEAEKRERALIEQWETQTFGSVLAIVSTNSDVGGLTGHLIKTDTSLHVSSAAARVTPSKSISPSAIAAATTAPFVFPSLLQQHAQTLRLLSHMESLKLKFYAYEKRIEELSNALSHAENSFKRKECDVSEAREELARTSLEWARQVYELEKTLSDRDKKIRQSEKRLKKAVEEVAARNEMLSDFQSALESLERDHAETMRQWQASSQPKEERDKANTSTMTTSSTAHAKDCKSLELSSDNSLLPPPYAGSAPALRTDGASCIPTPSSSSSKFTKEALINANKMIARLQEQLEVTKKEVEHLTGLVSSKQSIISSLREACERHEQQNDSLIEKNKSLRERVEELEKVLAEKRSEILNLSVAAKDERSTKKDTEALAREVGKLRGQLEFYKQQARRERHRRSEENDAEKKGLSSNPSTIIRPTVEGLPVKEEAATEGLVRKVVNNGAVRAGVLVERTKQYADHAGPKCHQPSNDKDTKVHSLASKTSTQRTSTRSHSYLHTATEEAKNGNVRGGYVASSNTGLVQSRVDEDDSPRSSSSESDVSDTLSFLLSA